MINKKLIVLFVFISMLLSGCIDVDRKIILKPDGSGTEVQHIKIDRAFYDMIIMMVAAFDSTKNVQKIKDSLYNHQEITSKIKDNFEGRDGVVLKKVEGMTDSDSSNIYTFEYSFDNAKRLSYTTNINPDDKLSSGSRTESEWIDKGNEILFKFFYVQEQDTTVENNQKYGVEEMFKGRNMVFDIEFPYDIITSNATSVNGRNAKWVFPMYEIYMNSAKLNLEAKLRK